MNISIGTPPSQLLLSTDTGSSITWVQCKPCEDFYEQNEPLFDPKESSSYNSVHCLTPVCFKLSCENELSKYDIGYGDNGRLVKISQFAIGSGHSNGVFKDVYSNGIVGLGTGKLSLISQLGAKIDSKFSYCLVYVDIGQVTVSFNDKRIPFKSKYETNRQEGNIAIDSGTTMTFLPEEMYLDIISEVKKATNSEGFINDGHVLYGNLAQIDFLVEYDLKDKKFSFKPTNCSKNN
ncbi:hypothetical protein MKW98_022075 [Papaver atlanticum]|uniref:Peptidase A1 domain-containing protein n=1 Tax=Papaver atlanticum TaxID=357466 RepID=A0AAD4TL02_9MAGN|nr:hypothetical protein MKW98_022075 [Papaver atlanticum]